MTVCPQCTAPVPETGSFCPFCGSPLKPEELLPADKPEDVTVLPTPEPPVEPEPAAEPEPVAEPEPAAEPEPTAEPEPVVEPEPPEDPEPIEEPGLPAEPEPVVEPEPPEDPELAEELEPAEERVSLWERILLFFSDQDALNRILRGIGVFLTAVGLLALLGLALFLIDLHRQQREARLDGEEEIALRPARTMIINYYSQPSPGKIRLDGNVSYVSDELIAVSAENRSYTDMERFFGERDLRVVGYVELTDTYQLRLPEEHGLYALALIAQELEAEDAVDCAAVNVLWEPACCALPEDPWDGSADWESMGPGSANWGLMAIRAPESWESFEPLSPRAGIIDSAFDPALEDLRYGLLLSNGSFVSARDASYAGFWQHGSAVAAVVGADHDNGLGLSGVAENCQIYACGSAVLCSQMDALSAIAELEVQGIGLIQYGLSWSEDLLEEILREGSAVRRFYYDDPTRIAGCSLERMLQKGYDFLLIQPAGNGLQGQGIDARYASVFAGVTRERVRQRILVVGAAALDGAGQLSQTPFSGRGERLDLLAPGADIYTALPEGRYARCSGSSFAAAHVTGICAEAWALNPALSGRELRDLAVETAGAPPAGADAPMADMLAALVAAAGGVDETARKSRSEQALDAYAALLYEGVSLRGRSEGISLPAQYYALLDMDRDGVQELLLYAVDEQELSASFALYGYRDGALLCLGNAWETCRYASWSNMRLRLEICDGRWIYAEAEKNAGAYSGSGERFWFSYDGSELSCVGEDRRGSRSESVVLIENTALTDQGVRIGSSRDELWNRNP